MIKEIYLAGGCFWGIEAYFSLVDGVLNTKAGYANGNCETPDYQKVCTGGTGFVETVFVEYDEDRISLAEILEHYFDIIDPTILNKQAFDIGTQYRTGVYYIDNADKQIIEEKIKTEQQKYQRPIVTEVKELENFYDAEEYHQKYLSKHPRGYCHIDLLKAKYSKKKTD